MIIQNVKGGYDFLPKEQKIRNYINETLKDVFEKYGYLGSDNFISEINNGSMESYGDVRVVFNKNKKLNNFWDELWIKFDDSVLQIQNSSLTWINKSKLISLKIINIFFEKQINFFTKFKCRCYAFSFY